MATPSTEQWVPKAEAAEMLGVSTREIERKAAAGRIRTQKVRLPGERNDKAVYAVTDITNVKDQREAAALQLTVAPGQAVPHALPSMVEALTAILQQTTPPRVVKAWLTLDEAAEHSGLTKTWLLKEAESPRRKDKIAVRDMGKHARGGRWRFFRGDLDRA